jgi:hypothetical protein
MQAALVCMARPVENVPTTQGWQVWDVGAARAVENSPAAHAVQAALVCMPAPVWYVPATQFWHVRDEMAPRAVE